MPFYLTSKKSIDPVDCWQTIYVKENEYHFINRDGFRKYEIDVSFSSILSIFEALETSKKGMEELSIFLAYDNIISDKTKLQIADYPTDFIGIQKFIENYVNFSKENVDKTELEIKLQAIADEYLPRLTGQSTKSFDMLKDSEYIYVSFLQDYTIDLIKERENRTMTYERFRVLLLGLSENSKLMKIINLRQVDIPEGADDKAKKQIKQAKEAVSLGEVERLDLKQKRALQAEMKAKIKEAKNGGR